MQETMQVNFYVAMNVCTADDCKRIFYAPCRTLKEAQARFDRIASGAENYGQRLYDPHKYGVMLSITRTRDGRRIRTMQVN